MSGISGMFCSDKEDNDLSSTFEKLKMIFHCDSGQNTTIMCKLLTKSKWGCKTVYKLGCNVLQNHHSVKVNPLLSL